MADRMTEAKVLKKINRTRHLAHRRFFATALLGCVVLCWSLQVAAAPSVAIAAFQALGVQKTLPVILEKMRSAYQTHTGKEALSLIAIQANLGPLGLQKLGVCAQNIACLVNTTKQHLPAGLTHALYVGVGGIGKKLLIRYIVLDLKTGQALHQLNQAYAGMSAFSAALPGELKNLFPDVASLRILGTPAGAKVFINDEERGTVPTGVIKASTKQPVALRVVAPTYKEYEGKLQLKRGKLTELTIKLQKIVIIAGTRRPTPPIRRPPPPITPVTQKGWFWAVIGISALAVGGGIAAGVIVSYYNALPTSYGDAKNTTFTATP